MWGHSAAEENSAVEDGTKGGVELRWRDREV